MPAPATDATAPAAMDGTGAGADTAHDWQLRFAAEVPRRLEPPPAQRQARAALAQQVLSAAGTTLARRQFVLVVDRSAAVQAALLYLAGPDDAPWHWIGATPVSTGRPGGFEHFLTPQGAFAHSLANPDFRAEGTRNEFGIRGYGERGMRVFDFGWVMGERTWGAGGQSTMRLQLHATDRELLEPRLGQRSSKGCVRVSREFNRFLDRHGLLDADYDDALARGERLWIYDAPHVPNPLAGRWMVVIDSGAATRPDGSPAPRLAHRDGADGGAC